MTSLLKPYWLVDAKEIEEFYSEFRHILLAYSLLRNKATEHVQLQYRVNHPLQRKQWHWEESLNSQYRRNRSITETVCSLTLVLFVLSPIPYHIFTNPETKRATIDWGFTIYSCSFFNLAEACRVADQIVEPWFSSSDLRGKISPMKVWSEQKGCMFSHHSKYKIHGILSIITLIIV